MANRRIESLTLTWNPLSNKGLVKLQLENNETKMFEASASELAAIGAILHEREVVYTDRGEIVASRGTSKERAGAPPGAEPYDARRAVEILAADFRRVVDVVAQLTGSWAGATPRSPDAAAAANLLTEQTTSIVGGYPTNEFRECCCIGTAEGPGSYFCSGTLIAHNLVLTAAHCTRHRMQQVLFGARLDDPGAKVIAVKRVIPHMHYRAGPVPSNDLCLLVLEDAAPIAPVSIATAQQLAVAGEVHLVGFGYNDPLRPHGFGTKRHVNVDITCMRRASSDDLAHAEKRYGFHANYEFVAGRKSLGRNGCEGDSGGPAYIYVQNRFVLAGVTSRATRTADGWGDGGVYVRPDQFADWIRGAARGES